MPRALVLGATGHIGAHVVRALLRRNYTVRAGYRTRRYLFVLGDLPVERVPVDLDDPGRLAHAVKDCDVVFHCAGYYPRLTDRRAEAIGRGIAQIRRAYDALRGQPITRVVFVSSAATIASTAGRPATEADEEPWPPRERRPLYAAVKIAMEHEVRRYARDGLPIVIVNPSVCLGEYDAHSFSGRLILLFARGRLPVYVEHYFNVIYTGDVAEACVAAAERGAPGQRYILSHENLSLGALATTIAREAGVRPPRWRIPSALAMLGAAGFEAAAALTGREPIFARRAAWRAREARHWLDSANARRTLGLPQTPVVEAVRRSLAWFREHRYC